MSSVVVSRGPSIEPVQRGTTQRRPSDYSDVPQTERSKGTFVSLYAGAGGLDLGFAMAGFSPSWVSELDPFALATHDRAIRSMAQTRPHLKLRTHKSVVGDLLTGLGATPPKPGSADLVIGGPPCQGFSVAGKMDPNDQRSRHVFHFLDVVERLQPHAFVMENVKALYENRRWSSIREALRERASQLGYDHEMFLLNAADYGAPQARERMMFIGIRGARPLCPKPTTANDPVTVREALAQLPPWGLPGNDQFCTAKITLAKAPVMRRSPYAGMLFNGAGRPIELDRPSPTLPASMGGNKTPIIDQQNLDDAGAAQWVAGYHSSLLAGGPGADHRPPVPTHLRRLTVEEAAVIQSFPLGLVFDGPKSSQFRQIGNAVPPRLGLAVASAIAQVLGV